MSAQTIVPVYCPSTVSVPCRLSARSNCCRRRRKTCWSQTTSSTVAMVSSVSRTCASKDTHPCLEMEASLFLCYFAWWHPLFISSSMPPFTVIRNLRGTWATNKTRIATRSAYDVVAIVIFTFPSHNFLFYATKLYEGLGYKRIENYPPYQHMDDAVCYAKDLPAISQIV